MIQSLFFIKYKIQCLISLKLYYHCSVISNKIQSKSKKSKIDKFSERCGKLGLSVALDIDIDNFEKSSENKFDNDNNKKEKFGR